MIFTRRFNGKRLRYISPVTQMTARIHGRDKRKTANGFSLFITSLNGRKIEHIDFSYYML